MAEFKEISKKRKRPSVPTSHSLMGIFTRSKSLIHLHRNRSANSRPDSTIGRNHRNLQSFVKKRQNSSPAGDSSVGYDLSSVSIKDLRLRRIFSPSSNDGLFPNSLDDTENAGKIEVAGNFVSGGSQEACENGYFKRLDISSEEFVESTPPNDEILGAKQGFGINGSVFPDQFIEDKPSENLQKHDGCMDKGFQEERNGMNYPIKSVLKPCSRVKLFKAPGSFSYRRLLPYLLDIEKDHSRSPTMGNSQNTEHGFADQRFLASNSRETLIDKSKTSDISLDDHNNESSKKLKVVSVESFTSHDNGSSSMPLVSGEIQKLELQVSCEDQLLNRSKHHLPSTIDDSHFNEVNLSGVGSRDNMLMDDGEFAISNLESPCNAQNLEVLNQTLTTVGDKCESNNYEEVGTKQSEIEGMPKATAFHSFQAQHLNSVNPVNPILSEVEGNGNCSSQKILENDSEVVDQVEDLNGECMLKTPPDSGMSSKSETDDKRGNRVDSVSQGMGHVMQKPTDETFHRNNDLGSDKSLDPRPENNLVPNTLLHLKLSKIPGSFSYRRLLPFLIGAYGNDQSPKVEKSSKEKPLSPYYPSGEDICVETFNGKNCPVEPHTGDGPLLPVAEAISLRCSSNHKLTQPPKQLPDSSMIMDLNQEKGLVVKPAALDINQKLETSPKVVVESPAMLSTSLINSGLLPRKEGSELMAYQPPLETEEDCIKSTNTCANREKQIEADSIVKASNPPLILSPGLKRGILKRNPRGCRGICTCLNCSSFRLHAERSFEFSRNQMQDAEEVAVDLIKELAYLRNVLEKSTSGAKDQSNICINQIKEACQKASDAEELAKTRLSEMNYDLNIHCRIPCGQRPSVRFANNVKAVLPIANSSNIVSK